MFRRCRTLQTIIKQATCNRPSVKYQVLNHYTRKMDCMYVPATNYGVIATATEKVKDKLGMTPMRYPKAKMYWGAYRLYMCAVELIDSDYFVKELGLPDTFNSWFLMTELHLWMIMVRLGSEGREGRYVRNQLIQALWSDIEVRSKKIGEGVSSTVRKSGVQQLNEHFQGALFGYDEGLLGDDYILSGAIWRNVFNKDTDEPEKIETVVQYIRKNIKYLESQSTEIILVNGIISFLPLYGEKEEKEKNDKILKMILNSDAVNTR